MKLNKNFFTHSNGKNHFIVSTGANNFNGMVKLNSTAMFIVICLKKDVTEDEIVSKMLDAYEVDDENARKAVRHVVEQLSSIGAIDR